ncbi:bacteriocin [Streptococcus cuniculipharyngis]|uniref:Bacteriocin n=1 Tax=Streptococcus cuniculipharyngis TaxID=1562651 RepID=A0A5C5SEA5_9STRE|nr:bacteriocin [Streptococcus cuniculipharyngis]TWS98742.1 bacteriocin [Streptococcus cuniculipharyngis]
MNTNFLDKFEQVPSQSLATIQGGSVTVTTVLVTAASYVAKKALDGAIAESTRSCQKNPNQWFCISVP